MTKFDIVCNACGSRSALIVWHSNLAVRWLFHFSCDICDNYTEGEDISEQLDDLIAGANKNEST